MTCIVGLESEGKVWIGGDSAGVAGFRSLHVRSDEKVWVSGRDRDYEQMAFGFTTSFRMGQILRYSMSLPVERLEVAAKPDDEMKFMSTTFIDRVRKALKDGGFAKVDSGVDSGGTFLVGWRGKLWAIYDDFQVGRAKQGFIGVGCGDVIAEGALFALEASKSKQVPKDRVLTALMAAEALNAGVRGPFNVVVV